MKTGGGGRGSQDWVNINVFVTRIVSSGAYARNLEKGRMVYLVPEVEKIDTSKDVKGYYHHVSSLPHRVN